jgi:hypothetical protein
MRNTFLGRHIERASRVAFIGGFIGLQSIGCGQSSGTDDTSGAGGTDTSGSGGDAQPAAGNANPTGTGGVQSAGGSAGSGGAAGTLGAGGSGGTPIVDAGPRVGPLKIMALGDSTTEFTCYRAELAKLLDKSHPRA